MGPSVSCSVCATCHELWPRVTDWLIIPMSPPQTKQTRTGLIMVTMVLWRCCGCCWRWSGAGDPTVVRTPSHCQEHLRSGTRTWGLGYIIIYRHWVEQGIWHILIPVLREYSLIIGNFGEGAVQVHWGFGLWLPTNIYLDLAIIISNKILNFVFSIEHEDQRQQVTNIISYVCRRLIECSECRTGSNNEDDLPLRPPRNNCVASAAGHRRHGHLRRLWYLHWLLPKLQI